MSRRSTNPARVWFGGAPLAALLLLGVATTSAAQRPEPPPFFAIEGATVHTAPGEVLENATVVVAHGLIEAVGTNVTVPPEAWRIDGSGLVVYAGLIDAETTVGIKQEEAAPSRGSGGGGLASLFGGDQPQVRGPEDRPGTKPWRRAADELSTEDSRLEKWRMAGFTSVIAAPEGGFFPGQAALLNTAGDEPDDLVVVPSVAQHLDYMSGGESFRSFPGSLMGKIAYVRQVFLDARQAAEAERIYAQHPAGLERPEYDRTLDPLIAALAAEQPFLIPGNRAREIERSLKLADELGFRPVIYGGQEAYRIRAELARAGVPVLVDVDWPEAPKDADPDRDEAVDDAILRALAPTTPLELDEAGVPFAFASAGLASPKEALEGVRAAVEAGLPADAALEALTIGAARIFGVDDRLGTVEAGKIANLVVATDLPWVEGAKVKTVFVDGHRFSVRETKPTEAPGVDASGTWELTVSTPRGDREMTVELEMAEDGSLTGELRSELGTTAIEEGRVEGSRVSFEVSLQMGARTAEVAYSGEIEGEAIEGTMSMGPITGSFSGTRTTQVAAKTETAAEAAAERPVKRWAEIAQLGLRGPYAEWPVFAIRGATIHTQSDAGVIENGTVLVRDGKIARVGRDIRIPSGAHVIDANGKHLVPGIIDAHSHIAGEGGINEGTLAVTAMVRIRDVVDPDDIAIYRALAGGVTTVNVLHGSANPIGGQNAVLKLRWGADADALMFEDAPPGIKFALGENPKRSRMTGFGPQRRPATRMGVMDIIREDFQRAREYQQAWRHYEAAKKAGKIVIPPRRDLKLEALAEILDGTRQVHAHSYRADEILQLLRLAEEEGFKIRTLQHVLEGYRVADEIAAHGAGASTFSDWWAYKVEAYEAIPYNAALMTERGVLVSINSDSAEEMRHLNVEAAKSIKWGGMAPEDALALVTSNPARQLGIERWVGSIEPGKDADLALYDGPPLSVFSKVEKTFVDGKLYFDRELDAERRERADQLEAELGGSAETGGAPTDTPSQTPDTPKTPVTRPEEVVR